MNSLVTILLIIVQLPFVNGNLLFDNNYHTYSVKIYINPKYNNGNNYLNALIKAGSETKHLTSKKPVEELISTQIYKGHYIGCDYQMIVPFNSVGLQTKKEYAFELDRNTSKTCEYIVILSHDDYKKLVASGLTEYRIIIPHKYITNEKDCNEKNTPRLASFLPARQRSVKLIQRNYIERRNDTIEISLEKLKENLQIYHEGYRFDSIPWSKIDFIAMIDNRLNFFSLEGIPFEEDYNTGIPKDFKAHIVIGRNLSLKSFLQSHPESKHIRFKENLAFNYEKLKRISKGKCLCQDPDRKRYELILDEWSDKPCSEKKQLYNSLFNDSEGRDVLGNYICTSNGDLAKILYSYFDDEDLGLELLKEKDYKRYSKIMNCLQDCLNEDFKQGEKLSCDCK